MRILTLLVWLLPTVVYGASLTLQWDANPPADQVQKYTVAWSNYSGNTASFAKIGSVDVTAPTTTVTIPMTGTEKWYFRVSATNSTMSSNYSNFVYVNFIKKPTALKFQSIDIR